MLINLYNIFSSSNPQTPCQDPSQAINLFYMNVDSSKAQKPILDENHKMDLKLTIFKNKNVETLSINETRKSVIGASRTRNR